MNKLESIEKQIAQLQERKKAILSREKDKKRKEETRNKIQLGGIVKIVFPDVVDKGFLLGALNEISKIKIDTPEYLQFKKIGDSIFFERENTQRKNESEDNMICKDS